MRHIVTLGYLSVCLILTTVVHNSVTMSSLWCNLYKHSDWKLTVRIFTKVRVLARHFSKAHDQSKSNSGPAPIVGPKVPFVRTALLSNTFSCLVEILILPVGPKSPLGNLDFLCSSDPYRLVKVNYAIPKNLRLYIPSAKICFPDQFFCFYCALDYTYATLQTTAF